jgi:hypothetical protein
MKPIVIAGTCCAILLGVAIRHIWREYYFDLTWQGCGVGTVEVRDQGSVHTVREGLDTIRLYGRTVNAGDLVARFERRLASIKPGAECWRDHRYTRTEYELLLAADMLIKIKHPKALGIFTRLLDDPLFVYNADDWLVALGDVRACPALLESWEKRPQYPYVYVNAFRALPYEPAVPYIIDVFRVHIGDHDAQHLFSTLETITGESLQSFRGRRLDDKESVQALKQELHDWWKQRQGLTNR